MLRLNLNSRDAGAYVEDRMRKWFKGSKTHEDVVDFITKTCAYEVKSCRLFNDGWNNNSKRDFRHLPHKNCQSKKSGRFYVDVENHVALKKFSVDHHLKAKYVFVIRWQKQMVWKVVDWEDVPIGDYKAKMVIVRQSQIFK